jgi:hypothetical protein
MKLSAPSPRAAAGARQAGGTQSAPPSFCGSVVVPALPPLCPGSGAHDLLPCDSHLQPWRERAYRAPLPQEGRLEGDALRILRVAAFLLLLFAGYCVTRLVTRTGLPSDGRRPWLAGDIAGACANAQQSAKTASQKRIAAAALLC